MCIRDRKYNIREAKCILNLDETGCNFHRQTGRSLRRGVGPRRDAPVQTLVRTRGKLINITLMPAVAADGTFFKPVVVLPGKKAHYRRVASGYESPIEFLPPCYLFYRDPAGVDSDIFFEWTQHFIQETAYLRGQDSSKQFYPNFFGFLGRSGQN